MKNTVIPIQEMKREYMAILQKKKVILENDVTNGNNPDLSLVIYLTTAKVPQYRLVAGNKREKQEAKKETTKNTVNKKLCLRTKEI